MVKCAVLGEVFFWGWYLLASGGCFWFGRLCADVTHPRPLSRGEFWMLLSV